MPRAETNRAKVRLLLGGAAVLLASLAVVSLLLDEDGVETPVVEIATPQASMADEVSDDLFAMEEVADDSLAGASSLGAQREVVGEWSELGEVSLRGRVLGRAASEAVEGARVTVFFEGGEVQTTSASGGEFELVVPAGVSLDAEAIAHGYNIGRRPNLNPEEEVVFRLVGATVIKGVILGPSADSFEEAQVRIWADDDRDLTHFSLGPGMTFTKMDGPGDRDGDSPSLQFHPDKRDFELFGLEPGEFDLSVEVPGWSYGVQRDVILRAGETTYFELELVRAGSAQARIVYEGTLIGVAGCSVEVTPWIQGLSSEVERGASKLYESDVDGWVEMPWLNPGESRVKIRALNGLIKESTERLIVTTNKREVLTWEIPGLHPLSGVVLDEDGLALKSGYVHVFSGGDSEAVYFGEPMLREDEGLPRSVEIGADGSYLFESVPAETVLTLSAVSSGEALAAGYSRVYLGSDSSSSNKIGGRGLRRLVAEAATHDFKVRAASRLEGLVQDSEGVGQADAKVHLYNFRRGLMGFSSSQLSEIISGQPGSELMSNKTHAATSDAEGRFVVDGVLPSDGWISAELDGYRKEWERVEVGGPVTELIIELQSSESLSGRVVDLDGESIPWARVNASKTGGSRRQRERWTQTNEFGRFEFKMGNGRGDSGYLDEGEWTFVARASGREPVNRPTRIVPGGEELLLTMGPARVADAASLRGKIFLADGTQPTRLRLKQLRSAALSVDGGDFRITGLNPGSHRLVFEARGCAPKSLGDSERGELLLSEGEDRDLGLITMYPGRELEVVVEAGEGRLDDAQVRFYPVAGHAVDSGSGTRRPGYERRGTYYMGALELGTWSMVVRASGHEKVVREIVLEAGSTRKITVEMKKKS